jgi:ABC-2 type transport system permease protein
MSLFMLFTDELRGFYRSNVMVFLWVGLPLISLIFRFLSSTAGQTMPFTVVSALVISSLAGTLASVMLAVSIINEKNRHVYELFLIRPFKRRNIIIAKFLAIYTCIAIAGFIAVILGIVADYTTKSVLPAGVVADTAQSLAISLSMMAVSSAAGVLIGVAASSVLVGVILVIYGGNQISVIPMIPTFVNFANPLLLTTCLGALMSVILLVLAVSLFNGKQF